jgi:GxxExxY protein
MKYALHRAWQIEDCRSNASDRSPYVFNGLHFEEGFRADILVEGILLIELKSTERYAPVHAKQVLTYLRLMDLPLGLLMNFGAPTFKDGVRRLLNDYVSPYP